MKQLLHNCCQFLLLKCSLHLHPEKKSTQDIYRTMPVMLPSNSSVHHFGVFEFSTRQWQFPEGYLLCICFANLCSEALCAISKWPSITLPPQCDTATLPAGTIIQNVPECTECHFVSSSAKPEIDFTCSFPSAKMKADEHGCSEATAGEEWGEGGDKTVEVTSDAKGTEMSFRLSARTSPPSLPRLLCVSHSGGAGSSQSVTRVLL